MPGCLRQTGVSSAGQAQAATKGTVPIAPTGRSLIEARIATARAVYQEYLHLYEVTITQPTEEAAIWSRHWMEDQLRLNPGQAQRLTAIVEHLERVKAVERIANAYARDGRGRAVDADKLRYFRLEAERCRRRAGDVPQCSLAGVEGGARKRRAGSPTATRCAEMSHPWYVQP